MLVRKGEELRAGTEEKSIGYTVRWLQDLSDNAIL
jgi:hypothetical protein